MKNHIVSPQQWEAARQQLLVKEKELTRARDALAAARRRMPWQAVEKAYWFDGPNGRASLIDLFEGRRQLIVYRAFFEPGVHGWPDHACIGCSMVADQVSHLAHLNARDTTLVFVSRAPRADIARLQARMSWQHIPWYGITDSFDADFDVGEWHGHNAFFREGDRVYRTYLINSRGDEAIGTVWSYLDMTALGRQEEWEDSPDGYPQTKPYKWWNWHDSYVPGAAPDKRWVEVSDAGEAAFRKRAAEQRDEHDRCPSTRGSADICDHGAFNRHPRRRCVVLNGGRLTTDRHGADVCADERLPSGAMAETCRGPATWRQPVVTHTKRNGSAALFNTSPKGQHEQAVIGGCACGAIHYEISAEPVVQVDCQCRDCQRKSGTGHGSYLTFSSRKAVKLTGQATHWDMVGDNGNVKTRAFCPTCGAPVYLLFAKAPDFFAIHAASLDDPARYKPQAVIYRSSGHDWDRVDLALPQFDKMPPGPG